MKALAEIQRKLKAPKNQHNSFGKYDYRSCEDILEALKKLLIDEKINATLTLSDEVKTVGTFMYIEATAQLTCEDQVAEVKAQAGINPTQKGMSLAQCFGASSSYARKYALAGLFLLDDNKDQDTKDNTKENREPIKVEEINETKSKLVDAYKNGELKDAFYEYNPSMQEYLRDFANKLRTCKTNEEAENLLESNDK